MTYYNLYYKGSKINKRPITEEEKKNVEMTQEIYKKNIINHKLEKIYTNDIQYVKTVVL